MVLVSHERVLNGTPAGWVNNFFFRGDAAYLVLICKYKQGKTQKKNELKHHLSAQICFICLC